MNEITPRFLPFNFQRKERGLDATKYELVLNESNARRPDGQRQGPVSPQSQFLYADPNGAGAPGAATGSAGGASGTGVAASGTHGTKQVETKNRGDGTKTVNFKDFKPPGWEDAAGNREACYKLACSGASQTAPAGQERDRRRRYHPLRR